MYICTVKTIEDDTTYFGRTQQQQEIDFIEELDGRLTAYEFKWKKTNAKMPKAFSDNYPGTDFHVISPGNYIDFIKTKPQEHFE